ncbi:MAG: leucine--tRNA ligase [Opitutaceae bacterium]|nr:leucine--tRNA ligase [Cytophagales bacterium]
MAEYNFREIESRWQKFWTENNTYKTENISDKPKYYVLDMFPYPSGAGLHVGHPLGYIASDIVSRYKKLKGFNVLHPMGFDSFGLPAEQYAVQTGQHPAITTENNIARYKEQLGKLGFSFDWEREAWTSKPDYYKWTQWIFIQLFHSWYNKKSNKAEPIESLVAEFEKEGNNYILAACDEDIAAFSSNDWVGFSEKEQQEILLKYRLTYLAETMVNWCPQLGTVLANEEVVNGVSERGGYPVERKKMMQWMMRITAYSDRLLSGLDTIDWPEPMKDMQRNWIGKSFGAEVSFEIVDNEVDNGQLTVDGSEKALNLTVFTTRVDTTFGVTYLSIAPEGEWVSKLTTPEHKAEVEAYVNAAKNRSERDRMSDVKTVSGCFTGSYAINPFNGEKIPVWIADYVLAGYGTGVVMAVPSSDERDFRFATHYNLPIIPVQEGAKTDITKDDFDPKAGTMINSGFLNGLTVPEAIQKAIQFVEEKKIGKGKIMFRQRDAIFARQRYWGEPIPVYFKEGLPYTMEESDLPLTLPKIDEYKPTETGEPPLARAKDFKYKGYPLELSTMPGWAGSSWYFLRYMDAKNQNKLVEPQIEKYWNQVDLYMGGAEHATGHLLYSRFWNMFLYDSGLVTSAEPFKKLINQGMIQGRSNFVYRINDTNQYVSYGLKNQYDTTALHVDVNIVENDILNTSLFKASRPDYAEAEFVLEDGKYICGHEVEKMSKSKYNVVNPDDIVDKYGADTLRLYEMFLGPLEQFKPWNTSGIDGSFRFLRKLWNLFHDKVGNFNVSEEKPTKEELKALHLTIKKVEEDIERFSFNTSVSTFMVCVNKLQELGCNKRAILQDLLIILSPYAPHITEELWSQLHSFKINDGMEVSPVVGNLEEIGSITKAKFPLFIPEYLNEDAFEYPISINGKVRTKLTFPSDTVPADIEKEVLNSTEVMKWTEGKDIKKVIVVPKRIVNVVF